eukprot:6738739-Prymnesium_polylepis.1
MVHAPPTQAWCGGRLRDKPNAGRESSCKMPCARASANCACVRALVRSNESAIIAINKLTLHDTKCKFIRCQTRGKRQGTPAAIIS